DIRQPPRQVVDRDELDGFHLPARIVLRVIDGVKRRLFGLRHERAALVTDVALAAVDLVLVERPVESPSVRVDYRVPIMQDLIALSPRIALFPVAAFRLGVAHSVPNAATAGGYVFISVHDHFAAMKSPTFPRAYPRNVRANPS